MFTLLLIISLYYLLILILLSFGIWKLKKPVSASSPQGISVIIAARNEEENIRTLLQILLSQNYPRSHYEIIITDDRSCDRTAQTVEEFRIQAKNIQILSIPQDQPGGKKRALALGISQAKFPLLAFTDADCLPSKEWLAEINRYFTGSIDFVAGYSPLLSKKDNLTLRLKNLERVAIFAISAGGMGWNLGLTCTARNMAYRKSIYENVNGFSGLEAIPSGDDDLMLQHLSRHTRAMSFMFSQNSIVPSNDNKDLGGQIDQETRRASKWRYYPPYIMMGTALVFVYYLLLFVALVLLLMGNLSLYQFLSLILLKIIAELMIITTFLSKIQAMHYLLHYPLAFLLHLPYFLFFALKGTFGKYQWKN